MGVETIKTADKGYVRLQAKVSECGIGLRPRLHTALCAETMRLHMWRYMNLYV